MSTRQDEWEKIARRAVKALAVCARQVEHWDPQGKGCPRCALDRILDRLRERCRARGEQA